MDAAGSGSSITNVQQQINTNITDISTNASNISSNTSNISSHTSASTGVHGVAGAVVGATDVQTLTNKTFDDATTNQELGSTPSTPAAGYQKLYFKDDGSLYKLDDAGLEVEVGSGASGSGGINYIENPDAEAGVTGWATYNDGDVATPVDGTGGAATITWEASSTAPLRGVNSFLMTLPGLAEERGMGVSYDFTIDNQDVNKNVYVSFDHDFPSNYVEGDITPFIYDVTNAALVDINKSGTSGRFTGRFSATDSTSYRLILHLTTNATFLTMKFDNFIVGPASLLDVPIQSYLGALTTTGSWTTNTTYTGKYSRNGEYLEGDVSILLGGAPTATALTLTIPSGLTIDTSKITSPTTIETVLGSVVISDSGTGRLQGSVLYNTTSTLVIFAEKGEAAAANNYMFAVSHSFPITFATNDELFIRYRVPILEWANQSALLSTAEMMNETIKVRYTSSNAAAIGTSAAKYTFEEVDYDPFGLYVSGTFTAPKKAKYKVHVSLSSNASTATLGEAFAVPIYVNGSVKSSFYYRISTTNAAPFDAAIDDTIDLDVGDLLEIRPFNSVNASTAVASSARNYLAIEELPDFSVYGVYGNYEVIAAESSAFDLTTAGYLTNEYAQMTGNSVTLSKGTWNIYGAMVLLGATSGVSAGFSQFAGSNGTNTSSSPTALASTTGVSSVIFNHSNVVLADTGTNIWERETSTLQCTLEVDSSATIYLVPRYTFTVAAGTCTAYLRATRLR